MEMGDDDLEQNEGRSRETRRDSLEPENFIFPHKLGILTIFFPDKYLIKHCLYVTLATYTMSTEVHND